MRRLKRVILVLILTVGAMWVFFYSREGPHASQGGETKPSKPREVKGNWRKYYWVDEMEKYTASNVSMERVKEEMDARRTRVGEECLREKQDADGFINSKEFLISTRYKVIWCNVFKAASSTWIFNFLIMGGKTEEELRTSRVSPVELARSIYPRPTEDEVRSHLQDGREERYTSFLIVREPFERLLSAFRDKIEPDITYYRDLRCQIVKKHGPPGIFVSIFKKSSCKPTFKQFVDHVLEEERFGNYHNEHWAPYYRFCSPCNVNFDLILKFETLQRDEVFLLSEIPSLGRVISPKKIHSSHTNYKSLAPDYFSQLSKEQLDGLLRIYGEDFRLFGYDEKVYYDYVK